jgi:transposase
MEAGTVKRPGRGRPRKRPLRVAGDKAYSNRRIRQWCRCHHVRVTIPRKADEKRRGPFDKETYKLRARIEQLINRLKQFRRIATRYEKRGANYQAMVTIGSILLYL